MKSRKLFRMQMILAGLAAAFFFAGASRAQEITNTEFNNAPNTVPFAQPSPERSSGAATVALTGSQAMKAAGSIVASIPVQRAAIAQPKSAKVWVGGTLLICVGLFFFSTRTAKNENPNAAPQCL